MKKLEKLKQKLQEARTKRVNASIVNDLKVYKSQGKVIEELISKINKLIVSN